MAPILARSTGKGSGQDHRANGGDIGPKRERENIGGVPPGTACCRRAPASTDGRQRGERRNAPVVAANERRDQLRLDSAQLYVEFRSCRKHPLAGERGWCERSLSVPPGKR